jgi:hypothetical protein
MKIAFLIIAHKNPEQVKLLLKSLARFYPNSELIIHINKNSLDLFENLKEELKSNNEMHFLSSDIDITWGDSGLLQAQLFLLEYAVLKIGTFDYFFYLSGQDFPISKNLNEFILNDPMDAYYSSREDTKWRRKLLLTKVPKLFINNLGGKTNPLRILRSIFLRLNLPRFGMFKIKNLNLIKRIEETVFYSGFFWVGFNRKVSNYIFEFLSKDKEFLDIFITSNFLVDECFWPTILNNYLVKYPNSKVYDDLMIIKKPIDNHPPILTIKDLEILMNKKNKFFARKFDIKTDREILEYLANNL